MRHKFTRYFLLVFITIFMGAWMTGCGTEDSQGESKFFQMFSVGEILAMNRDFLLTGSSVESGGGASPTGSFDQRHQEITIQVAPENVPALWEAIEKDIEALIQENGGIIEGVESGDGDFIQQSGYYYRQGGRQGLVRVWGIPGEVGQYHLVVQLVEVQR